MAVRSGQIETAALLASRGANTDITELDRLLGAWAAGLDRTAVVLPAECHRLLPEFAANHQTAAVRALLAAGVPLNTVDSGGATALHWACWHGHADLVELLIDHGASSECRKTNHRLE